MLFRVTTGPILLESTKKKLICNEKFYLKIYLKISIAWVCMLHVDRFPFHYVLSEYYSILYVVMVLIHCWILVHFIKGTSIVSIFTINKLNYQENMKIYMCVLYKVGSILNKQYFTHNILIEKYTFFYNIFSLSWYENVNIIKLSLIIENLLEVESWMSANVFSSSKVSVCILNREIFNYSQILQNKVVVVYKPIMYQLRWVCVHQEVSENLKAFFKILLRCFFSVNDFIICNYNFFILFWPYTFF